jgi:hypothetical protein
VELRQQVAEQTQVEERRAVHQHLLILLERIHHLMQNTNPRILDQREELNRHYKSLFLFQLELQLQLKHLQLYHQVERFQDAEVQQHHRTHLARTLP